MDVTTNLFTPAAHARAGEQWFSSLECADQTVCNVPSDSPALKTSMNKVRT